MNIESATPPSSLRTCREQGYEADAAWAKLPDGWSLSEVTAIATDSRDRVFVFDRGEHPVLIFERDGTFVGSWGEGVFSRPHGIHIGPDDMVYCTDDLGHTVRKFTPDGRLLMTLGTSGVPSDSGATSIDYRTIVRSAPPFHFPTNVALSSRGEIYVSDGYGNARIHKFSPDGRLLFSWGEPGDGPGQFHVPHGIAIDAEGAVHVADRENHRIQRFSPDGEYLGEWAGIARACQVFIGPSGRLYVAELGYLAGMWPGTSAPEGSTGGRLTIFDRDGSVEARWGGGRSPCSAGDFFAPHDIWVDSRGDIYLAEVALSAGGNRGLVPRDCHTLQKFTRIRDHSRSEAS